MRILVCGGRDFEDWERLFAFLDELVRGAHKKIVIIHGDARGADRMGGLWGHRRKIDVITFPADWDAYGNAAGHIRNQQMIDEGRPDCVVACPGGRGTADMVQRAMKAGVPVYRV